MSGSWDYYYEISDNLDRGITGTPSGYNIRYTGDVRQYTLGDEREFCEYCHGYTKVNDYGNCIACGAPKIPQGYLRA